MKVASKNDGKIWELSGGIAVCAECGGRMVAYTTRNSVGKAYHYYRCHHRHVRHRPAEGLEKEVVDAVVSAFHPDAWESFVEDLCNRRLDDLHRLGRSDPVKTRERLAGRIGALQTKITRARELFIEGDLPRPDYDEKKSLLQDEIELVQEELTKVDDLDDEVGRVEALRRTLLSIENPLSGHYAVTDGADPDAMMDNILSYGSRETAAKRRQDFYRRVGMRVRVGEQLDISLGIGEPRVGKLDIASA